MSSRSMTITFFLSLISEEDEGGDSIDPFPPPSSRSVSSGHQLRNIQLTDEGASTDVLKSK